jgi:hypothetical protein
MHYKYSIYFKIQTYKAPLVGSRLNRFCKDLRSLGDEKATLYKVAFANFKIRPLRGKR